MVFKDTFMSKSACKIDSILDSGPQHFLQHNNVRRYFQWPDNWFRLADPWCRRHAEDPHYIFFTPTGQVNNDKYKKWKSAESKDTLHHVEAAWRGRQQRHGVTVVNVERKQVQQVQKDFDDFNEATFTFMFAKKHKKCILELEELSVIATSVARILKSVFKVTH